MLHKKKYLAEQNLCLRGPRESRQADNDSNVGNFLGLIKFLADFNPVLREHFGFMKSHPHSTSYLSQVFKRNIFTSWHLIFAKTEQKKLKHPSTIVFYLTQLLTRRIASRF